MSLKEKSSELRKPHMDAPPEYSPASGSMSRPLTQTFQTTFACVSLNMTDRLRFIRFPAEHAARTDEAIRRAWPKGIQEVAIKGQHRVLTKRAETEDEHLTKVSSRSYGVAREVKLRGNPWSGISWDHDKAAARNMMSELMGELYAMGWVLKQSVDLSKKQRDKDSLLFRYQQPPPPPCDWLNISFLSSDKMYIQNAPPELCNALLHNLGPMVQRHQQKLAFEIKLNGSPWFPSGEEAVTTRVIALSLLEVLEQHGYSLYAAIDQDNGPEGRGTDTWHCCRLKGWVPGQPVYHS